MFLRYRYIVKTQGHVAEILAAEGLNIFILFYDVSAQYRGKVLQKFLLYGVTRQQ